MNPEDVASITVFDHLRPTSEDHPPGVYRVVGTGASISLLRVTDARGRRRATGDLRSISHEGLSGFEVATDPDAGVHPLRLVRGVVSGSYWEVRSLLKWLLG